MQIRSSPCLLASLSPGLRCVLIVAVFLPTGCEKKEALSPAPATSRASVALKVLVVNDAKLAEAINRLRGEWAERSGGTLTAEAKAWPDVAKSKEIDADLIIFPAQYLGELAEAKRLRPVRESALGSKLYDAADVLPLAREKLGKYGGKQWALPLSVVLPMIGVINEVPTEAARPVSWWPARESVEHWPAIMLLARAASYASHPHQEAVLFDPQTMAARIVEPPFVRALEEWQQENSFATVDEDAKGKPVAWTELPPSAAVYNRSTGAWEAVQGGQRRVPFLAGGQLLAVTAASRNAASAFDLAVWLASPDIARQLGPIGTGSVPVRRSQANNSARWMDSAGGGASESSQVAEVVLSALQRDEALVVPRIPGSDEYMAALSTAVEKALRGEASAEDALADATRKWDRITEHHGRDAQRRAYLKDLGIESP